MKENKQNKQPRQTRQEKQSGQNGQNGRIHSKLLTRQFRRMATPGVASSLAKTAVVLVDSLVAGIYIGYDALAAIELAAPFLFVDEALHCLLGSGTSVQVAQAVGAGDRVKANRIIGAILPTVLIAYLLVFTPCLLFAPTLLTFWSDDPTLISTTMQYLIPTIIAMPFFEILTCLEKAYRIDGRMVFFSVRPVVTSVCNVIFDILFVSVFDLGITGLAIASIVSTFLGYCITISHAFSKKCTIHPDLKVVFAPKEAASYIKVNLLRGGSPAVSQILSSFAQASLCKALLLVGGTQALAVWNVCSIGITLASAASLGLYNATILLVGFLFGEDDYSGVRIVFKEITKMALIVGAAGFVFELTAVPFLYTLYGFVDMEACIMQICAIAPFVVLAILREVLSAYSLAVNKFGIAYASTIITNAPKIVLPFAGIFAGVVGVIVGYLVSYLFVLGYFVVQIKKSGTHLLPVKGHLSLVEYSFDLNPENLSQVAEKIQTELSEDEYGRKTARAAAHLIEECGVIIMGADAKDAKGAKDTRGAQGAKDAKDAQGAKDAKDATDSKGTKGAKDVQGATDSKGTKGAKDVQGAKGAKGATDSKRALHLDTRIVADEDAVKIVITDDGPANNVAETILQADEQYALEAQLIRAYASDVSYDRILELNRLIVCIPQSATK